jgi:hypothetical protein
MEYDELNLNYGRKWKTHDQLEEVIAKIQSLGYSIITASIKTKEDFVHTIAFVDTEPPYTNIKLDKPADSRLDALLKGILQFIEEYKSRPEIKNDEEI